VGITLVALSPSASAQKPTASGAQSAELMVSPSLAGVFASARVRF
jgi:hypothetical protein